MSLARDEGYDVTSIGKLHFKSGEVDNGFTEEILPMHIVDGKGWVIGLLRENPPFYESAAELADEVGKGSSSYTDYDRAITEAAETWLQDLPVMTTLLWVLSHWSAHIILLSRQKSFMISTIQMKCRFLNRLRRFILN